MFEFDINGVPTLIMVECGIPMSNLYKELNSRQIKMLETWSILDVVQTDLYKALLNLKKE